MPWINTDHSVAECFFLKPHLRCALGYKTVLHKTIRLGQLRYITLSLSWTKPRANGGEIIHLKYTKYALNVDRLQLINQDVIIIVTS